MLWDNFPSGLVNSAEVVNFVGLAEVNHNVDRVLTQIPANAKF